MQYLQSEGWIHLTLKLKKGAKMSKDGVLKFASGNDINSIEVGSFKELKTSIKLVFRKKQTDGETQ